MKLKPADYDTALKKDLLAEITQRQQAGRKIELKGNNVEHLVAALVADDAAPATKDEEDAEELTTEQLRLKAIAAHDGAMLREVPEDLADFKGRYQYLGEPKIEGEVFGLKIVPAARHSKTHHAKSAARFGDYTEKEFRDQFEKL